MDTAVITWLSVLALVCVVVLSKMFFAMTHRQQAVPVRVRSHRRGHHIVEFSNEREMLFIPGDYVKTNGFDNDCNADDNY